LHVANQVKCHVLIVSIIFDCLNYRWTFC
jgi:hypothetical protein